MHKACDHAAYDALTEIDGGEDAYVALNGGLLIAQPLLGLLGQGEERPRVGKQPVTGVGQAHAVGVPAQQHRPTLIFQVL